MRIDTLLRRDRVTFSCELFPPKVGADLAHAKTIVREIAALKPDFISVTYGAGGGTSKRTVEIAADIQSYGIPALAHMTCIAADRAHVASMMQNLSQNGIENILALRGDRPQDADFVPSAEYRYASDLVEDVAARGEFCIGAACYPEGHVECEHQEEDLEHLKHKVDCGCSFLTSQMFFDNNVFYNFLYRVLKKGITVPVIAGIMPVINSRQIRRSCELSGAKLPPRFRAITDKFGDDPAAMRQAGIAYAMEQIIDLVANGVNHIHLYTMNRPDIAREIVGNLSEIIR